MRARWIFVALAIVLVAEGLAVAGIMPMGRLWQGVLVAVAFLLMILLYRNLVSPISTITNGMDLLNAQDFSSRLAPVGQHDADKLVGMFNHMMDCLKHERLRQLEQHRFLTQLIDASPMGIAILDFNDRFTMANPAMLRFLEAASEEELRGRRLTDVEGDVAKELVKLEPGQTRTVRLSDTMVYRCGRLWFMDSGFRRPFLLVETLSEEVSRAERAAYGKVIRTMAHEVNNTVAGITSILETLIDVFASEAEIAEALESCHERCGSMGRFITSYANVVKIPPLQLERIDLNQRVARVLPFLEGMAGERVEIAFHPSESPAEASVDVVLFEQSIVNIVKNAVESISGSGRIDITVTSCPSTLVIADNGAGISEEASRHIFSPFYSTKPGGQGLGLMFVSEILRRHGFRFSLRTSPSDGLTRFTIVAGGKNA